MTVMIVVRYDRELPCLGPAPQHRHHGSVVISVLHAFGGARSKIILLYLCAIGAVEACW